MWGHVYPARQRFLALSSRWETRVTSARNRTIPYCACANHVSICHAKRHFLSLSNLVRRASFPLTSGRKTRALGASISGMRHRYHTCTLRTAHACAIKPDMQNSVISIVIWKWMLPELSFSDRWSRGTKLWERDWSLRLNVTSSYFAGTACDNFGAKKFQYVGNSCFFGECVA